MRIIAKQDKRSGMNKLGVGIQKGSGFDKIANKIRQMYWRLDVEGSLSLAGRQYALYDGFLRHFHVANE